MLCRARKSLEQTLPCSAEQGSFRAKLFPAPRSKEESKQTVSCSTEEDPFRAKLFLAPRSKEESKLPVPCSTEDSSFRQKEKTRAHPKKGKEESERAQTGRGRKRKFGSPEFQSRAQGGPMGGAQGGSRESTVKPREGPGRDLTPGSVHLTPHALGSKSMVSSVKSQLSGSRSQLSGIRFEGFLFQGYVLLDSYQDVHSTHRICTLLNGGDAFGLSSMNKLL